MCINTKKKLKSKLQELKHIFDINAKIVVHIDKSVKCLCSLLQTYMYVDVDISCFSVLCLYVA